MTSSAPSACGTDAVRPLATLTVDHRAIAHNVGVLRDVAGVPVLAVVKADGFGLGMPQVARTALLAGASALGVATVDEALALRSAGIVARVVAFTSLPLIVAIAAAPSLDRVAIWSRAPGRPAAQGSVGRSMSRPT